MTILETLARQATREWQQTNHFSFGKVSYKRESAGVRFSFMSTVSGIDVSDWQDPCPMGSLKPTNFMFVYAKVTEGTDYISTTYLQKQKDALAAGLMFGGYHFFDWSQDPTAQAEAFIANVSMERGNLPPALDCEGDTAGLTPDQCVAAMATWLQVVGDAFGRFPVVYMSPSFWSTSLASTDGFTGHPLWVADYNALPNAPSLGSWQPMIWQYTSQGSVDGISGGVDFNEYQGTLAQLQALGYKHH